MGGEWASRREGVDCAKSGPGDVGVSCWLGGGECNGNKEGDDWASEGGIFILLEGMCRRLLEELGLWHSGEGSRGQEVRDTSLVGRGRGQGREEDVDGVWVAVVWDWASDRDWDWDWGLGGIGGGLSSCCLSEGGILSLPWKDTSTRLRQGFASSWAWQLRSMPLSVAKLGGPELLLGAMTQPAP